MSSDSDDGCKLKPTPTSKQKALSVPTTDVSSKNGIVKGDPLQQASGLQITAEPPKPAIRQRAAQRSVQVDSSLTISGGTVVSELQHVSQRFSQQVQISSCVTREIKGGEKELFSAQNRPQSTDGGHLNIATINDPGKTAETYEGHLLVGSSRQTVNTRAQNISSSSNTISTQGQASARHQLETLAGSQLSASDLSQQQRSSRTKTQRTVASRAQVSTSSARFSSSSISGEAISAAVAAKALVERQAPSAIVQRAFASKTASVSSTGRFSLGATSSASQYQQLEEAAGSSIQFRSSSSLSASHFVETKSGDASDLFRSALFLTPSPTSAIARSSLAGYSTPQTTSDTDPTAASRRQVIDTSSQQRANDDKGREVRSAGETEISSFCSATTITDGATPITIAAAPTYIWTTSATERAIASKYLDKSFRSISPSVGANLLVDPGKNSTTKIIPYRKLNKNNNSLEETATTLFALGTESVAPEESRRTSQMLSNAGESTSEMDVKFGKFVAKDESPGAMTESASPMPSKGSIELKSVTNLNSSADIEGEKENFPSRKESISGDEITSNISKPVKEQISTQEVNTGGDIIGAAHDAAERGSANDIAKINSKSIGSKSSLTGPSRAPNSRADQTTIPIISATIPNVDYSAISTNAKSSTYLPLPTEMLPPQRSYPKKVFFIIVNEFCERFSFYGLKAILLLYLRGALGFSDSNSTVAFHLFTALCYMTPVIGAILADSVWGKFKTILYLSIVYFFGEFVLVLSSIFWNSGNFSIGATFLGLTLIGLGTGGIKPCVGALGGDQFYPHETHWRQTFFSIFYASINIGALLSMFITPLLRSNYQCVDRSDCFPYAFGLPCILMLVSIIVFGVAKNKYYLVPLPEKNVLIALCKCIWLAIKRKFSGYKLPGAPINLPNIPRPSHAADIDTSSSNLSVSSNEEAPVQKTSQKSSEQINAEKILGHQKSKNLALKSTQSIVQADRNHWLYLAADKFDTKSIEDFRSVLGAIFLMLPMPVYWCLFDQQGSLWTLQATRMDGRVFGTSYVIEPDQMNVLNPLLLLTAIPLFEMIIYPLSGRCNVLTSSIQRITAGGLLLSLAFVSSALIEIHIQQYLPPISPYSGQANLLLVNGLSDCSLSQPMISYIQIPSNTTESSPYIIRSNSTTFDPPTLNPLTLNHLKPLSSRGLTVLSATNSTPINHYRISFKLTNFHLNPTLKEGSIDIDQPPNGCPFGQSVNHELELAPLKDNEVKLLYLEQGNGKLTYRIFNDSLELPPAGKARVRLLYEFFGSATLAHTHQFYLHRATTSGYLKEEPAANLKFHTSTKDGQVLVSQFMDVDVKTKGELLYLRTNDKLIGGNSTLHEIFLEPGTRNLIMVHQNNATNVDVNYQLLQDNKYRISILYQLIPYLLLSMSEVLFCITSLDFSYSMAPKNMKTILLAAYFLSATFGNLLTVAIESLQLFPNLVSDFFFYAVIMVLDMVVFAIMGYYYSPPKRLQED